MLRSPRLPYNSVVYRQLLRKSRSLNRFQANRIASARHHVKRPYEFHIGCSYAGKPEDPTDKLRKVPFPEDTLIGGWRDKMLAWPKGVPFNTAGEDFFFVQEGVSFGVADGVGGWVDSGVDPSLFSQSLMYHAHRYSRNAWAGEPEIDPTMDYEEREQIEGWEMTPYECLDLAYGGVLREKFVQAGSSTACIISLNASSGVLRSANLGDSGFSVIRGTSIIYHQKPQTHFFNCPKQLTKLPPNAGRKFARACVDAPSEADVFETKLRDGDIVISYTDGFSDNVFPVEMLRICRLLSRGSGTEAEQVQGIADRLIEYSRKCMFNKSRVSPFESQAARQGIVTVIVALVRETT
ncbi:hypothetical protein FA13DRAFT_1752913 [Coprinellus micaceus]|uniref:Protein phosphatase n=1 Tax=Coprinellus micaceus TaxID=71717 RepID=A0A4Y7TQA4_COPMI|nr:hypothetical protein FA13DRAFT_1752913 [Coprinellus micaceus]